MSMKALITRSSAGELELPFTTARTFENDGSLASIVLKNVKRVTVASRDQGSLDVCQASTQLYCLLWVVWLNYTIPGAGRRTLMEWLLWTLVAIMAIYIVARLALRYLLPPDT